MAHTLIQTVFQGNTGRADDRYVTTTHWRAVGGSGDFEETADAAFDLLREFWETNGPAGAGIVGALIPTFVNRSYQMRAYNQDLPPFERSPYVGVGTLPTVPANAGAYPSEVAIVLSFVGGEAPFTPADRGRIYVGPLILEAGVGAVSGSNANRPTDTVILAIADAANRMRNAETPGAAEWCTRSLRLNKADRATPLYQAVAGGFVDNSFDTQRRRGEEQNDREYWGTLLGA